MLKLLLGTVKVVKVAEVNNGNVDPKKNMRIELVFFSFFSIFPEI